MVLDLLITVATFAAAYKVGAWLSRPGTDDFDDRHERMCDALEDR